MDDLAEEIRSHLEMEEQENLESGMPPDEAHYAALRRFGNVTLAQERSREMWGWNSVETAARQMQLALRTLLRHRGAYLFAIGTLALGIGMAVAMFSLVDAVLLHPLPFPGQNLIQVIWKTNPRTGVQVDELAYPELGDLQENIKDFEYVAVMPDLPLRLRQSASDRQRGARANRKHPRVSRLFPRSWSGARYGP